MQDEISVRQWQERFKAGAFSARDTATQCAAGWYDWFCQNEALAGRLKKIARVVMGITDPFILDNYYVWFKEALIKGPSNAICNRNWRQISKYRPVLRVKHSFSLSYPI